MPSGKSHGKNREYQVQCKEVLQALKKQGTLSPYSSDGIDVAFPDVRGTTVTFDVALKDPKNRVIVCECRRRKEVVKQEALFSFARKVELLRKHLGMEVAGIFFTRSTYQIGAVKHGAWSDSIQTVVLEQNQTLQNFVIFYHSYDIQREKRMNQGLAQITNVVQIPETGIAILTHANGSVTRVTTTDDDTD